MPGSRHTPFIALGGRSASYEQGYRAALKACAAWLHEEAEQRGRKARPILRQAAQDMSREAKHVMAGRDEEECKRVEIAEVFSAKLGDVWPDDPRVTAALKAVNTAG